MWTDNTFKDYNWKSGIAFTINDCMYDLPLNLYVCGELEFSCGLQQDKKYILDAVTDWVNDCVYKILENGCISCFCLKDNIKMVSEVVGERLSELLKKENCELKHFCIKSLLTDTYEIKELMGAVMRRAERVANGISGREAVLAQIRQKQSN